MDHLSDQELLVAARTDAAAFAVFYRRHARAIHAYFSRRVREGDEEIAERLGCSESVVRQRVSRGLRTLHARLKETATDA